MNEQLIDAILKISRWARHEMMTSPKVVQLTMLQLEILTCLKQHKKAQGKEIAQHFHIAKSTVSTHIDKLQQLKLIQRLSDSRDRRVDWITLTAKGKRLLNEGIKRKNKKMNKFLTYISTNDKRQLLKIMTRLINKLEEKYEEK